MQPDTLWKYSGVEGYDYEALRTFPKQGLHKFARVATDQARALAASWSNEASTEWAARNYLALKCVLYAELLLDCASYSIRTNLYPVVPYLVYYAYFSTGRALALCLPERPWSVDGLAKIGHGPLMNAIHNASSRVSADLASRLKKEFERLREDRELFSYTFPAKGKEVAERDGLIQVDYVADHCRIVVELAVLSSECVYTAVQRSAETATIDRDKLLALVGYDSRQRLDGDDRYRLSYLQRKIGLAPFWMLATKGLEEDFRGSWLSDAPEDDVFDPDSSEHSLLHRL